MLLQTGHYKTLCPPPAVPSVGLGTGLNQQTQNTGAGDWTEFANKTGIGYWRANEVGTRKKCPTALRNSKKDRELRGS